MIQLPIKEDPFWGRYINCNIPVLLRCHHLHQWSAAPTHINSSGSWCPKCANQCPEQAKEKFYRKVDQRQGTVLGSYINTTTKIRIRCDKNPAHEWDATPGKISHSEGTWCPYCRCSKGEEKVRSVLQKYNVTYEEQHIIDFLPNKRFDFCLINNGEHFLIEFDGKQHFEYTDHFHKTETEYHKRQQIDILKHQVALQAGYHIIHIDHLQIDNVEAHICKALQEDAPVYYSTPSMYTHLNEQLDLSFMLKHVSNSYLKKYILMYITL